MSCTFRCCIILSDESGISLVAFHYNIGIPLEGVDAGQYNVDVRSPSGELILIHSSSSSYDDDDDDDDCDGGDVDDCGDDNK